MGPKVMAAKDERRLGHEDHADQAARDACQGFGHQRLPQERPGQQHGERRVAEEEGDLHCGKPSALAPLGGCCSDAPLNALPDCASI